MISRIVSGGQTGVDRAALQWAIEHGMAHGGWCPAGRKAEDGVIPMHFLLTEVPDGGGYLERTRANVRDADATLIVSMSALMSGGTKKTADFAKALGKPWIHIHPGRDWKSSLAGWLGSTSIGTLNVAGPRASTEPGAAGFARRVLDHALDLIKAV